MTTRATKDQPSPSVHLSREEWLVRRHRENHRACFEFPEGRWLDERDFALSIGFKDAEEVRRCLQENREDAAEEVPIGEDLGEVPILELVRERQRELEMEHASTEELLWFDFQEVPNPADFDYLLASNLYDLSEEECRAIISSRLATQTSPSPRITLVRKSKVEQGISAGLKGEEPKAGTLAALQSKLVADSNDLLEGLVPAGTAGALIGAPKAGKSMLLEQLSLAVASGEGHFLGRSVASGVVLFLALESSEATLRRRFSRRLDPADHWPSNFHYRVRGALPNAAEERVAALRALCKDLSPMLVVIDTLAAYAAPPSGQSLYSADYRITDDLRALAEERCTTIIFAHHSAKRSRGNDPATDSVSTSGFAAGASFIFELSRKPGSDRGHLVCVGNDIETQRLSVAWDAATLRWELAESASPGRPANKREHARTWLAEKLAGGPMPTKAIFEAAVAEGIGSSKLIEYAKADLGIRSKKQGSSWLWLLPQEPATTRKKES